jgi:hypothetical protein
MTDSQAPLNTRIFATRPVAMRALAAELRRNPRASAAKYTPLASTRLEPRPPLPGRHHRNGATHPDREAGSAGGESSTCPPSMTK